VDSYTKVVMFETLEGKRMVFEGERISNPTNLVSSITARKLLRNGCIGYLAYILNFDVESPQLKNIHVVKEFPYVFPE